MTAPKKVEYLGDFALPTAEIFPDNIDQQQYYDYKIGLFAQQNKTAQKGQIVFVGDSITDLFPLENYFADVGKATYNRGISGDSTIGVLNRMENSVFATVPQKIVLLIGTNDVNYGYGLADIADRYAQILNIVSSVLPHAQLVAVSVPPQNEAYQVLTQGAQNVRANVSRIQKLNRDIAALASSHGYCYLDIFSRLVGEDGLLLPHCSDDGLHLNANGFAVWTNLLRPLLL